MFLGTKLHKVMKSFPFFPFLFPILFFRFFSPCLFFLFQDLFSQSSTSSQLRVCEALWKPSTVGRQTVWGAFSAKNECFQRYASVVRLVTIREKIYFRNSTYSGQVTSNVHRYKTAQGRVDLETFVPWRSQWDHWRRHTLSHGLDDDVSVLNGVGARLYSIPRDFRLALQCRRPVVWRHQYGSVRRRDGVEWRYGAQSLP